ncbi:hypothetical protein [Wolbachia endosymbiont of Drosophila pseudotakahashii]|uniref:hypothetical protein n=1 Tax=Wolbachia endosymbiont of Drosophila pseudotakahashii TaxID=375919 RepID=UPI002230B37B|nr:hypothetical protein [Wolbachia endosymbiont of Drosophila pseudotakahashii]MCX3065182.1 hypothetical protein [Wolbachia endosymbiont of Drosophila pseudotakahashii]UZE39098.1 hypothetical protein ONI09_03230 [Wolbachia endosymbiont of Drosophila pseudotakahashii]
MHGNGENIGLIRSLLNGDCQGFMDRFESFLDQSPSFLHSVSKDRFFPAFFFGMFATAHDAGITNNNERIFFRFDNNPDNPRRGNLKIAVLTRDSNNRRIVRCYTIADRGNSVGSRFSLEEREWIERHELQNGPAKRKKLELEWEEYKTFVWAENLGEDEEEEAVRCRQFVDIEAFTGESVSPCNGFMEVARTEQQGFLSDLIAELASNDADNVMGVTRRILQYVVGIYDRYGAVLGFDGRESDYHGFLSGFLMNFRYRHAVGIYLELFVGGGYTDITFLVRGVQRLGDSVPIIIELKAGRRSAADALEQAENYVNTCPVSSVSIHTSSENAVCVGLNFDLNRMRFQLSVENFLEREPSLLERLFQPIGVDESVRDFLLYPLFGLPAVPDVRGRNSRLFSYTTGFVFGSTAFARGTVTIRGNRVRVTKHLFQYSNHDNNRMLGPHGGIANVNIGERILTMILYAPSRNMVVVFNICNMLTHQFPPGAISLLNWPSARVNEIVCTLDPTRRDEDDLGLAVTVSSFQSPNVYLQNRNNVSFQGNFFQVGGVGDVRRIASIMMNTGWQDINRHQELFQAISRVLFPLRWIVNRNDAQEVGFHSILHGLFYACDNPARLVIEFQLGGRKLDLVLLRSAGSVGGTHPTGIELKFATAAHELRQKIANADEQLDRYMHCRGFKRVTDGDTVVLSYAIFNDYARVPNTLISNPHVLRVKNPLEHSSIREFP